MDIERTLNDIRDAQNKIHGDVSQIRTVLLGVPDTDDKGLCGSVKNIHMTCKEHETKINRLYILFWIVLAALAGTGALTGIGIKEVITMVK